MGEVVNVESRMTRRRLLTGFAATGASLVLGIPALANIRNDEERKHSNTAERQELITDQETLAQFNEKQTEQNYPGEWQTIAYTDDTHYTDADVIPGAIYEYRVSSVTSDWQSDWSSSASASSTEG